MLNAQAGQFTLNDEGQILYQDKVGSPLPGAPVAQLVKGESALAPIVNVTAVDVDDALKGKLETWLATHIATVLEPLVALKEDHLKDDVASQIGAKIYEALGVVARADIEDLIAQLDEEKRAGVRAKKVRLGPILAFQPDLNKPAPVRLRALLWSLFNDKPLPAPVPKDGVVSYKIAGEVDQSFYQMIGYPVYGGRAIRIDMLDRVVNAVYESADKGKFQAQHKMAEWLGSPIADLYAVLEALGHTKIHDPAEDAVKAAVSSCHPEEAQPTKDLMASEQKEEILHSVQDDSKAEEKATEETVKPQEQIKPELATFALKKGKANQKSGGGKSFKPHAKKEDRKKDSRKDFKKDKGKRNKNAPKQPKVMSAEAKVQDDSPFAILQQLKK